MTQAETAIMVGMSNVVQIPEETLAALLREAGRTESVEAFLASIAVRSVVVQDGRLRKRAKAASWSRFWLVLSAAVTWLGVLLGPDVEGVIAGVLLTGMSVVEFRVHRLFAAGDALGAIYGWWNQCLFAALFLVYGLYHGTFVTIPSSLGGVLGDMGGTGVDTAGLLPDIQALTRVFYYSIGIIGATGQFWLACYYRAARQVP